MNYAAKSERKCGNFRQSNPLEAILVANFGSRLLLFANLIFIYDARQELLLIDQILSLTLQLQAAVLERHLEIIDRNIQ